MAPNVYEPRGVLRPRPRLRLGLALRRRPALRWGLTALAGLGVAALVGSIVARAEDARTAWGTSRVVLVAIRDLVPGDVLRAGDVDERSLPEPAVPEDRAATTAVGRTVHSPIYEGEVVVAARLAPEDLRGVAVRLPEGTRAVAVPAEVGTTPPLEVGQLVDVIVAFPPDGSGAGPPGIVVAEAALVVDVAEAAVTVAVEADTAPRLAVALAHGALSLALVGP
ncbi:MAG: SAF domain-containing protein [Acidimicrobiales bacterium]|nr:SAF domain-containing protein [Acidimicrobiales bacterium]